MNSAASFGQSSWFNRSPNPGAINPRAIARGFDRYLAPHGIRTQAQQQGDGCLCLVVECQTQPERDRLVQFILHRLKQLNLAAIAGVKIVARLTGQSNSLWDHSVSFMPPVPPSLSQPAGVPRHMPPPPPPNPALAHRSLTDTDLAASQTVTSAPPDPFTALAQTLAAEAKTVTASVASVATRANRYYRRWGSQTTERKTSRRLADLASGVEQRWTQVATAAPWKQGQQAGTHRRQPVLKEVAHCLEPLALERKWQVRVGQLGGRIVAITLDCPLLPRKPSEFQTFHRDVTQAVCKRLWSLNSPTIRGVRLGIREVGQDTVAWQQTIRLATPASRSPMAQFTQAFAGVGTLGDPVWDRIVRSLLLGGTAIVPFVLALWLTQQVPTINESTSDRTRSITGSGSIRSDQTEQVIPAQRPVAFPLQQTFAQADEKRSPVVETALEIVPVTSHTAVTPSDETVTLLFGGDVTLSNFFEDKIKGEYGKTFAKMPEYAQADVSMVNLENPLTTANTRRPGKSFNFKAKPESVEALTSGGVDIVTLGNNHAMDYQGKGLAETLEHLEKAGIHAVGGGRDILEARRPKILDVKGKRIAYFGYYNAYWHAATDGSPGTNPRDFDSIKADMEAVRDQVDWIVVNYHWGEENAHYPAGYQRSLAQFTIDHGADLIVGHHPHVLQGAEVYKGKAIVYSLGNFIFGGNSRRNYVTAALQVSLTGDQMKLEFLPLVVQDYQPQVLQGDRGQSIFNHLRHISRNFNEPLLSGHTLTIPKGNPTAPPEVETAAAPTPDVQPISQAPAPQSPAMAPAQAEGSPTGATVESVTGAVAAKEAAIAKEDETAKAAAIAKGEDAEEAVMQLRVNSPAAETAEGFSQAQTHLSQSQVALTAQWAKKKRAASAAATGRSPGAASLSSEIATATQEQLGQTLARARAQLARQQSIVIAAEIEATQRRPRSQAASQSPSPMFSTAGFTDGAEQPQETAQSSSQGPQLPFENKPAQPGLSFAIADPQTGQSTTQPQDQTQPTEGGPLRSLTKTAQPPLLPFLEGAIQRAEASFW